MKELIEIFGKENLKFEKGFDGSVLVVDKDYFFDYQMVCTFAKKIKGAKVIVYDNIGKHITDIKLRKTFYESLVKAGKNPYPENEVFTVSDEKRFWDRFLTDTMGNISKYYKDGVLSRNLLFPAANAMKQEMFYDGNHSGLKCFKNRFQAFIQIAFDLHIGDYIFYKREYDCPYDEDEEETYCFNENDVYLGIWGKKLYLLGIYIPSETTSLNKDGVVKTILTKIKDFRKEIVLDLNVNLDYLLDLEDASKGLSSFKNHGLIYAAQEYQTLCRHGQLKDLPVIGQKEIILGDFHYILDDRSDYYVISSVEFIDNPKETDDKGLFKYQYQRDGNGKILFRGILNKGKLLYSYLFGERIELSEYKEEGSYRPFDCFPEMIAQLVFAKKNMELYPSIIGKNTINSWTKDLMHFRPGFHDMEGEYWLSNNKLIVDEEIEGFYHFYVWHDIRSLYHGTTIIDYTLDNEAICDRGTLQFAKIADAIPYIEGNNLIPVDKRKSIVEKLNKYSDYLREEGDKKCRADREASLKQRAD